MENYNFHRLPFFIVKSLPAPKRSKWTWCFTTSPLLHHHFLLVSRLKSQLRSRANISQVSKYQLNFPRHTLQSLQIAQHPPKTAIFIGKSHHAYPYFPTIYQYYPHEIPCKSNGIPLKIPPASNEMSVQLPNMYPHEIPRKYSFPLTVGIFPWHILFKHPIYVQLFVIVLISNFRYPMSIP